MSDDDEVMWAQSLTGDDFQCVHVDAWNEAKDEISKLKAELDEAKELLKPLARHADVLERHCDMKDINPETHMVAMSIWVVDCQNARTFLNKLQRQTEEAVGR